MGQLELDEQGVFVTCGACGQKNRLGFRRLNATARCGRCKHPLSAPGVPLETASSADFERLIAHATLPVVVDYWAPWCGPCRMVASELEKVAARSAGRWLIVKVNIDAFVRQTLAGHA